MRDFSKITRLRSIREKQARSELGQARNQELEAREEEARRAEAHREALAGEEGSNVHSLRAAQLARTATAERSADAGAQRAMSEQRTRAARGAWQRSVQDLDIAENLDERRRQSLALTARRTSDRMLDELMTMRRKQK